MHANFARWQAKGSRDIRRALGAALSDSALRYHPASCTRAYWRSNYWTHSPRTLMAVLPSPPTNDEG
jgi:hypothetical protein